MEPRSFNRGDANSRKRKNHTIGLQWSHGRLTVVTQKLAQELASMVKASMEPRSFNRGDNALLPGWEYGNGLQWSHGRLTVVTPKAKSNPSGVPCFIGATVFLPW